jgi:hypothetical protein
MKVPPRQGMIRGLKAPPANPSGDQLIREYLTRLTHAGLRLPKGQRMAFVGRTKARIEREIGPEGISDPGRVLEVLASLGEPEELVQAERAKIDEAWRKHRAASRDATDTQPIPHRVPGQPAVPASGDFPTDPGSIPPVTDPSPAGPQLTLAATGRLARGHLLETAAIVLLGVGGVLFPIVPPLWVLGSLLALASQVWDLRDRAVAFFGPVLITATVAAMIAVVNRVPGDLVVIYVHAFADGAGYLLRFGCVASAVYLAWRVHRGPRVKVPPWRREPVPSRGDRRGSRRAR